ncbi:MAG: SIS domain-containing protein [Lachnospiraceae bacterium]|nr:SIS domain-containing protein [Lachnospiraceae bacterium]
MIGKQYASQALDLALKAVDSQYEQILSAANIIYDSLKKDGLLHVFGCGHSHIFMEECFYRAGGLVPVNPIFETSTMLHEGAIKSSLIERMMGYAPFILDNYNTKKGEVLLIFSTSGINSLPIEMALAAKEKGLTTIAMTSLNYKDAVSRYPTGEKLCDVVDIVIDTQTPCGDAILDFEKSNVRAIPVSSLLGMTLLNTLMAEIIDCYEADNASPPVFISGNLEGGLERNKVYLEKYQFRVKAL